MYNFPNEMRVKINSIQENVALYVHKLLVFDRHHDYVILNAQRQGISALIEI